MQKARNVFIYHAGCPDGFGAAWAARAAWGEAHTVFVARGHEDAFSSGAYRGDRVVFADIAPPRACYRPLARAAQELVVLDHHVTARAEFEQEPALARELAADGHTVHFDLEHSGAVLAWNWLHPQRAAPPLFAYLEDCDLWRWRLDASREVNAVVSATPRTFADWDALLARPIAELARAGAPLVRENRALVARALDAAHPVQLGALQLEAVSAQHLRADIGHHLAERARFGSACGVVYRVKRARVSCTLYSIGDFDAGALAASFGGGGHKHAAGFTMPRDEWEQMMRRLRGALPRPRRLAKPRRGSTRG